MRIWFPIGVQCLDKKRLIAEHNEILIIGKAVYAIKNNLKYGYKNHPETLRWIKHTKALKKRHDILAEEMVKRGFNHKSPWPDYLVDSNDTEEYPTGTWEPLAVMVEKLQQKQK